MTFYPREFPGAGAVLDVINRAAYETPVSLLNTMDGAVPRSKVQFDKFTVALLIRRHDAPQLGEKEGDSLQDAHLAHLAKLHDKGFLLAAGPLQGSPDEKFRDLSIFRDEPG